jgi:predicted HTH domain antitoxin
MADTIQINLRIDVELASELEAIAREESLRKTDVARRYLINGVRASKLDRAIRLFQQQRISLARAAEEAGLSRYELIDELRRRGIALDPSTPEDAREALMALIANLPPTEA